MEKDSEGQKIKCLIFRARNESMGKFIKAINEAKDVSEKAMNAKKLLNEVENLLRCKYFKAERIECEICHGIAELRRRTANLIIKAKELAK